MDPLRADDIERHRRTPTSERASQALEVMRMGIRLKRTSLRTRFPGESADEIEKRVRAWLVRDTAE